MTRLRYLLTGLCALTLSGCLSTNPAAWTDARDQQTQAKLDIYECKREAADVSHRASRAGGVILPIVGLFAMRSTYNECMEARGWGRATKE